MNIREIREKAKAFRVKNYSRLRKEELIWAIQRAEGHSDCFNKIMDCGIQDCCWRGDCQQVKPPRGEP